MRCALALLGVLSLTLWNPAAAARVEVAFPVLVPPTVQWSGGGAIGVGGFEGRDADIFEGAVVRALQDPHRGLPKGAVVPTDVGGNSMPDDVPVLAPARVEAALSGLPPDHPTVHGRLRPLLGAGLWVRGRLQAPDWDERVRDGGQGGRSACIDRAVELRAEVWIHRLDATTGPTSQWVRARTHQAACAATLAEAEARIEPIDVTALSLVQDLAVQVAALVAPRWELARLPVERTAANRAGFELWAGGRHREAAAWFMWNAESNPQDAGAQAAAAVFLATAGHLDESRIRARAAARLQRDDRWERVVSLVDGLAAQRDRLRQMGLVLEPLALQPSGAP